MDKTRMMILFLLAVAVADCVKPEAKLEQSQSRLTQRVAGYHEALGWRDWSAAARFVVPRCRLEFQELTRRLDRGYTLDSWVVRDLRLGEAGDRAEAVIYRSFIMPPSVTMQSESLLLSWVLIDKEWYLEGPPF